MNSIPEEQNTQPQLDRLAAQRKLYSRAKQTLAIQATLSIPCAIAWSVAAVQLPHLKAYAACWGVAVALLDLFCLTPRQKRLRGLGACVQEEFDCHVLQLPWRDRRVGSHPVPEIVAEASRAYWRKHPSDVSLRNWYPAAVGRLPLEAARLICQRANCWWDASLRRRYAAAVITVGSAAIFGMVCAGIYNKLALDGFLLSILAPMLPVFLWCMREARDNLETAASLEKLQSQVEGLWARVHQLDAADATAQSVDLQNDIYESRRRSPLILDWINNLFRSNHEGLMQHGAEEFVKQYEVARGQPGR